MHFGNRMSVRKKGLTNSQKRLLAVCAALDGLRRCVQRMIKLLPSMIAPYDGRWTWGQMLGAQHFSALSKEERTYTERFHCSKLPRILNDGS